MMEEENNLSCVLVDEPIKRELHHILKNTTASLRYKLLGTILTLLLFELFYLLSRYNQGRMYARAARAVARG